MDSSPVGGSRNSSVVVITLDTGETYVISSLSSRTDTHVIRIDPTTGALNYDGKPGFDVFKSESEALNYVTNGSKWLCKSTTYARALLGYVALGSYGLLLVATKLNASIPNLPGGGCVYIVAESQWIKIPLQYPQPLGKGEVKNAQELTDLEIDGKHYFCDTRDITRPFPSRMPLEKPDDEFVWNGWLSVSFRNIGLQQHCVILLQGFVEYRRFGSSGQLEGFVALVARRSRLHPGTRYLARGMNSCFSTGNEVECEQLVWVPKRTGQSIPFNTYIWRRGTIPMWWGAELKMTAAEAEIYVSDDPYRGSSQYYKRLSKRYDSRNLDAVVGEVQQKKAFVPIVCINLLRSGEGKSESILVQHFEESINHIRSTGALPDTRILLINYDWHASVKLKGETQTIEGLWKLLKAPTTAISMCEGDYLLSRQRLKDCRGEIIINNAFEGAFCLRTHQNGVIRFNCADSLDRTNAASFFGALQVFVEQCRRLGISLDSDLSYGNQSMNNYGGYIAPLPPGWEKRADAVTGKTYFIDHNTKTTTWMHPCPDKPWKRFDMTFEEFKRSTILSPVSQLADLFLLAGDIHATLYTGSKAMHSQILNIFNEETGGKFKQFSAAANMKITLQRRYKNVVVDSSRQKQLEMFLGLRLFKHLPSLPVQPLHVASRPSGFLLKPIANMFPDGGANLLSFKRKDLIWVCPQAADVAEVFIYLAEPCHVCQLLLTISHGADDSTYPSTVDVRTGRSLDGLKLVVEAASVPQCVNGTNLFIPLPGTISAEDMAVTGAGTRLHDQDTSTHSLLYDFEELEGELDFLTRVVALTFYPAVSGKSPMTFGEIEILGVSLPWSRVFSNEGHGARLSSEVSKRFQKETNPFSSSSDTNPFSTSLPNTSAPTLAQQGSSANNLLDLLSGDMFSEPVSQPVIGNTTYDGDDFFPPAVGEYHGDKTNNESSSSLDAKCSDSGAQNYTSLLKSIAGSHMDKKLNYVEAMKLEIERLRLNISAAERDRILLSVGTDPASINPNLLLDDLSTGRLCKVANSLALLGHASLEDRINGSIGLEPMDNSSAIDFWNITEIGETCSGGACQVCVETKGTNSTSSKSIFLCSRCERKVCKVCCAGKGALLVGNYNSRDAANYNGGSGHGSQTDGTNQSVATDSVICKQCCPEIVLNALILDYIRVLVGLRRHARADGAAHKALDQIMGSALWDRLSERNHSFDSQQAAKVLQKLLGSEESLAEFPSASILHSVESAKDSAPFLSLLAPLESGSHHSYWKAPANTSSVDFAIVLSTVSDVSGVIFLVSPCGYSDADAPTVQIWASNKIHREEKSSMGKWDIQSLIRSSSEFYGPEKSGEGAKVPRHVKFSFKNPVRCRIIWITLRLQRAGSSSINFGNDFNLLSLDENPFAEVNRRASFGATVGSEPCLHAKRILVIGNSVKNEMDPASSQGFDQMNLRSWLERPPKLNRFKVPIEGEALMNNDLVLEQYLPPVSPPFAGFRLDAPCAIKPRVTHSPSSDTNIFDTSVTYLEERHISPAVLYLQVSALQGQHNMVTIAEYRLPEVKAGTAMYFDFPREVQTRTIVFKLLGDVAAFSEDQSEQDDYGMRTIAAGLSLSNRIKLYYYADPYELGKWASLSAV
ncbi:hypothetical protein ACFE04_007983 [Oxalis oulophora]